MKSKSLKFHSSFIIRHYLGGLILPAMLTASLAIKIGDQRHIYFDPDGNSRYHRAIKSTDMKTWQHSLPALSLQEGIRHGTVSTVPANFVQQIQTP